jgi:4-amino-4-deoxy-L-arabinose transferase-like glycosyltransferase
LGSLCKPAIIFFVPGILVALLLQKATLRDKLTTVSLLLFVLALLLLPWTLRNFLAFNEFIPPADNGPVNFYLANNPSATGDCISPSETPLGNGNLPATIYYREGFRFMLSHPTQYLKLVLKKIITVLSPDNSSWMLDRLVIPSSQANQRMYEAYVTIAELIPHLFSMVVILLGCFGCALLFQFEQSPLLLPTLSYLLIHVLFFFFNIRFRLLSEPAAVVYTGGALSLIISQNPLELYRSYRLRLVGAFSIAFIIVVLWISFPLFS